MLKEDKSCLNIMIMYFLNSGFLLLFEQIDMSLGPGLVISKDNHNSRNILKYINR